MTSHRRLLGAVNGLPTSDGAGVSLLRVVGTQQIDYLDPFLMLDEFKNDDPGAYVAGFPEHPHRGFETVSYMKQGAMRHRDSAGNEGVIQDGGVQWMTAGRGIIHSEMPEQTDGLLWGYQLWVNLPASQKMTEPRYQDIQKEGIPEVITDDLHVRIMAGNYAGTEGASQTLWPVEYMDVMAQSGAVFRHDIPDGHNVMIFVYDGTVTAEGGSIGTKQLGVFAQEGTLEITASEEGAGFLVMAGKPIGEPVAKMGPFVMNTEAEIRQAVQDFRAGRFA
ncbi:MAG: pirin family protein [Candidatus Puniceispirillaceae bacterium]